MTDSQSPEPKPGPANPQAEGVEAVSPPGGPQRQDATGAGEVQGGHADDASASHANDKHAGEAGGHTIALEDEQPGPRSENEDHDLQRENAETSLDQPSEG